MTKTRVSIAVLPFRNLSPDSDTDYFTNGFVEDLTADLTRFSSLRVLAAESAFALGMSEADEDAATRWDLDFLLTGSLRRTDANLRVGVQLVRMPGRETVWAERFDASLDQVFYIQDQITATVAGRLSLHVEEATLEFARRESVESLPAYECWLRGMDCLKCGTLEGDEESRPLFERALQIDPQYARAYSGLSLSHFNEWTCQAWHLWDENEKNAFDYASQAARIDDRDAMVHSVLARVYRFRHQHRQADQHADRALALNPNDAHVLIQVAIVKLFGGEPKEGFELACKAMELNPLHGDWYHGIAGWNLFMLGQYDKANQCLEQAGEAITNYPAYRAACAAIEGNVDQARNEYELFLREYRNKITFGRQPQKGEALVWAIQVEPFRRLEDSQRMPNALMEVGIESIDVEDAIKSRKKTLVRPADVACAGGNEFRCDDGIWSIAYEGSGARLTSLKGFHDIARLLAQPNESLHCLELSGSVAVNDGAIEVLDEQARREYRQRIEELQEELEQAEVDNDPMRAEPARIELETVIGELARATGLGGQSRRIGGTAERARSAVTWRIRSAVKKINVALPRLGQHLSNSIRTGNFCVYSPESEIEWEL